MYRLGLEYKNNYIFGPFDSALSMPGKDHRTLKVQNVQNLIFSSLKTF